MMGFRLSMRRVAVVCGAGLMAAGMVGCAAPNKREVLSTTEIYKNIGPYSQMVSHGNTIYFSGVLPLNMAGNAIDGTTIEAQTHAVLKFMGAKLRSQGLSYDDVLATTVYLKDMNEFAAMNKVYGEYFKNAPPARATVEVARLPRDVKIEIAAVVGRR